MSLADGRDIALLLFMFMAFAVVLVQGVLLFFIIRGLRLGRRKAMPYVHLAQYYFSRIARATERGSQAIAAPFVAAAGLAARVEHHGKQFVNIFQRKERKQT
ncbi:MAG: hypothetical protein ABI874_03750 [Chloroflexota bacterium]